MPMNELARAVAASVAGDVATAEPGTAARRYLFAPDFPGFSGHFPGDPILPAIVQMMTVVSFASDRAGTPLKIAAVANAKFLSPIRPDEEVLVRYRKVAEEGKTLHDAALTAAGRPAAAFLLHLVPAGDDE
jgi:3-hydroxyacyl-[acyl-carrier-protein] dehydratase